MRVCKGRRNNGRNSGIPGHLSGYRTYQSQALPRLAPRMHEALARRRPLSRASGPAHVRGLSFGASVVPSLRMSAVLSSEIESRRSQIAAICARLGVRRLELFGSGARGGSPRDLDFLVDLGDRPPGEYASAYFALREQLESMFSLPVDLITPSSLANPYFRERVEQEKTLLYAA